MKTLRISLLLPLLLAAPSAFAQGPLAPTSAPTPTMKTLAQIEPRKPIDATNTPGDANSVFKITAAGSYYLTGNVAGVSGKHGISVAASNVTIDLGGFVLNGVSGSLDGVHMEAGSSKLTLRNGTIAGWQGDGVDEVDADAQDGIYENLHVTGNSFDGLRLDEKCVVTACKTDHNGVYGISVNGQATIKDCTSSDNGSSGIFLGKGSVLDSVVSSNGECGIEVFDEPVLIKNCVAFDHHDNAGVGVKIGVGGKVADCVSRENNLGVEIGFFGSVTGCMVKNNALGVYGGGSNRIVGNMAEGNSEGISFYENRNVIDGNQVLNGGTGIRVQSLFSGGGVRNLIIRNTVGNNFTNFDIVAGNRYGPIVDLTAGSPAAVVGNSATSTLTAEGVHPWANFTYAQEPAARVAP